MPGHLGGVGHSERACPGPWLADHLQGCWAWGAGDRGAGMGVLAPGCWAWGAGDGVQGQGCWAGVLGPGCWGWGCWAQRCWGRGAGPGVPGMGLLGSGVLGTGVLGPGICSAPRSAEVETCCPLRHWVVTLSAQPFLWVGQGSVSAPHCMRACSWSSEVPTHPVSAPSIYLPQPLPRSPRAAPQLRGKP